VIEREIFHEFQGFDPAFRYLEDIELGYRLHQAGHRILLKKDIQLTHHKRYTLWGLIKSDVMGRAKPWTELMLTKRIFRSDLNTRWENVLSVPTAYGIVLCLVASLFWPFGWRVLSGLILIFLILNHRFFFFILHEKGVFFLMRSILLNGFGYLYSGAGLIMGVVAHIKKLNAKR
jgi:hypothetical protein